MRENILQFVNKHGAAKVSDFLETGFSRAYIQRFFGKLVKEGKLVKIGSTKSSYYVTPETAQKTINETMGVSYVLHNLNLNEDTVLDRIKHESGIFLQLPINIQRIVDFAFTETLNNAIEHSETKTIAVVVHRSETKLIFIIEDYGIGIFQNILNKRGLKSTLDAIQDLTKGKQTTMPHAHTGQGLFFTSRAADKLVITSSDTRLIFDNILDDIFIEPAKISEGTRVYFEIGLESKRILKNIFNKYTDKDSFEFTKTDIRVKLYKFGTEYISRSQARRLLVGLDEFESITLDFSKIKAIGQGFADEVFRVWKKSNQGKRIIPINMNKEIEFMIKRAGVYK